MPSPLQPRLFDPGPEYPEYAPGDWMKRSDVVWHASAEPELPSEDAPTRPDAKAEKYGDPHGMHFGSLDAAIDRRPTGFIHPRRIPEGAALDTDGPLTDRTANFDPWITSVVRGGKAVSYTNDYEGKPGEVSWRVLPEVVRSWNQDVMSNPHAPEPYRQLAETHTLVGTGYSARRSYAVQSALFPHMIEDISGEHLDQGGRRVGKPVALGHYVTQEEGNRALQKRRSTMGKNRFDVVLSDDAQYIPLGAPKGNVRLVPKDEVWKHWR